MSRQKKLFLVLAVLFFILLIYASVDIGRRTTFPGTRPKNEENVEKMDRNPTSVDTVDRGSDSLKIRSGP